jgi:hypothetical protein
MTERWTDEQLRELAGGKYGGSRRIAPLATELLALRASNRSAYREIKRLRQKLGEAGVVVEYGPDTPIFDE